MKGTVWRFEWCAVQQPRSGVRALDPRDFIAARRADLRFIGFAAS